ncbi:MAG: CAP domain-containing protein [Eudoraea sp.]|nr:CAP domain-containing protein [Eudoraea sp.]
MKMRLLCAVSVLFVLVASSCSKEAIPYTDIPKAENAVQMEQELMGIVNTHRSSLGFPELQFSAIAYEHANNHTDYMISKGSLNHDNFSARATSISSATDAEYVAENVAKDYDSAAGAFENWLASSDHRKTMEGDFTHTAVSVKKDPAGNFYYTQLFYR